MFLLFSLSLSFLFIYFYSSFTSHLDLFFSLPPHFDFISPVLFVVVLMFVSFGFANDVAAS